MTASKIEKYFVFLERNRDKQEKLVEIMCFVNVTVNFIFLFSASWFYKFEGDR